jgi:hypothetical protein
LRRAVPFWDSSIYLCEFFGEILGFNGGGVGWFQDSLTQTKNINYIKLLL